MKRTIQIHVAGMEEMGQRFVEAWRRTEGGESPAEPREHITFPDVETLFKTLTPRRWTLLKTLRKKGPLSVRSLAQALERDYKNVHTDVRELEQAGLIERTEDDRVCVPWQTIVTELNLEAA